MIIKHVTVGNNYIRYEMADMKSGRLFMIIFLSSFKKEMEIVLYDRSHNLSCVLNETSWGTCATRGKVTTYQ